MEKEYRALKHSKHVWNMIFGKLLWIGSILNPLAGICSEDTRKKGKGAKTGASHDWWSFYLSLYDWLNGNHNDQGIVCLPNETDYSYCEFVAPNTPYCVQYINLVSAYKAIEGYFRRDTLDLSLVASCVCKRLV